MYRKDLGTWGTDLTPGRFNNAIIAAAILSACKPQVRANLKQSTYAEKLLAQIRSPGTASGAVPAQWDMRPIIGRLDSEVLAGAWESMWEDLHYHDFTPVRIEFSYTPEQYPGWLINQFYLQADPPLHSHFFSAPAPEFIRKWLLPLRVGFLPDNESRILRNRIETEFPYPWLIKVVNLQPGQEHCDLLLLPQTLKLGMARILSLPFKLTAGCVLAIGETESAPSIYYPLIQGLRTHLCAAAVAVLKISPEDHVFWFEHTIAEWSHNNPLDLALFHTREVLPSPPPILVSDPGFLSTTRIEYTSRAIASRLRRSTISLEGLMVPERLLYTLDPKNGFPRTDTGNVLPTAVPVMAEAIEKHLDMAGFAFHAESSDAKDFSELAMAMEDMALPPAEDRRHLQARIREADDAEKKGIVDKALIAGRNYEVQVAVSEPQEEWLTAPTVFPDHKIDYSRGVVKLNIFFVEPNLAPFPLCDVMELEAEGASSICRFQIEAPQNIERFHARILVAYQNRILQSIYLTGRIVARPTDVDDSDSIEIGMESVIWNGFEDLENRRRFDAALVVNHTDQGTSGAAAFTDEDAGWIAMDGLETILDRIRRKLNDIARDPGQYGAPDTDAGLNLIRYFAYYGRILYNGIIGDWQMSRLAEAKRIQVVSARAEGFLPLEFVYDGATPKKTAVLCPNTDQALKDGECPLCPQKGGSEDKICLLGFWSLKKVIERHAFDANIARNARGDFMLYANPRPAGNTLEPMRSAVFGASSRVDAVVDGQRNQVAQALRDAIADNVTESHQWDDWIDGVRNARPSLLVLLPHTLLDEFTDAETLEIGMDSQLRAGDLTPEHIRPDPNMPPPVVLLLGCETGVADVPFESYVAAFRRNQAAMVVSTLSKILGRHAVPVAEEFIRCLKQTAGHSPMPFGEIATGVRRNLVAKGFLIALALTAYGDADWLVSP